MVATPLARIGLLRLEAIPFRFALTFGASVTLSEARVEQVLKARFIVGKLLKELANVCLFHVVYVGFRLPYVKGIHPF